jgi:type VI secretion system protein ImpH
MAASNWGTARRLDETLFASPYEFDFFQAVRLLTLMHAARHDAVPSDDEVVRFCAHNSLDFPASAVATLQARRDGRASMAVTFLGLTGLLGALPLAYTEIAIDRESFGDHSLTDFFDVFNHRLIQLFFEAWRKHHFYIGYETSLKNSTASPDAFTSYLFDLIGMGTSGLRERMPFSDFSLLHYCGLTAQQPHSADALRALLHDYFGVPVNIEQFRGKWHTLETEELCQAGDEGPCSQLGLGAVAGSAVWSRQALVRIVLGPLTEEQFGNFLPDKKGFLQMAALARWFLGPALEFEIQLVLRWDEVPGCRLADAPSGARLGWSAWFGSGGLENDAGDAVFNEYEQVSTEAGHGTQ